jgi:hypothetical protein
MQQPFGIKKINELVPEKYTLSQNYPNPFNPSTNIQFAVPSWGKIRVSVYDIRGKLVLDLFNGYMNAGNYIAVFDAGKYPSGIYFCVMKTERYFVTRKMMLVK